MKKGFIFPLLIILVALPTAIFAQTTPPPPPSTGTGTVPDALFNQDPVPIIVAIAFTPVTMIDIGSSVANHIRAEITDDGTVTVAKMNFGTQSGILDRAIDLTHTTSNYWEADLPLLDAGTNFFTISATDNSQQVTTTNESTFTIAEGTPKAPSNINLTAIFQDRFTLNWNASDKATSYFLEVSKNSDFSNPIFSADIGNILSTEISGLNHSTTYNYRIKAIRQTSGSTLESAYSIGTVETITALAEEPSDYPKNFRVVNNNGGQFTIYWDQISTGIVADGFVIKISTNPIIKPNDGIPAMPDQYLSDQAGTFIVDNIQKYVAVTLPGYETIWTAQIFPFKGNSTSVNYKTDGEAPQAKMITPLKSGPNGWINEFHYDNVGTDLNEMVEVVVENTHDFLISDFQVALYNGSDGKSYATKSLPQTPTSENSGFSVYEVVAAGMQNGPDGIALIYQNKVIQFISYGGSFTATNGHATGMVSTNIGVTETTSTPVGQSLQLSGNGSNYGDFGWQTPKAASPGSINIGQIFTSINSLSTNWTGNVSSDWNNAANWDNGVPISTSKVIIPAGKSNYPDITSSVQCKVLILESDANLAGQQFLPANCLLYTKRKLTAGKWLFLTPPIIGVTSAIFKPLVGLVYMIAYDNSKPADQSAWNYISDQTALFMPGKGYGFYGTREEPELVFNGLAISNSIATPLHFSPNGNNWNFLGNPFLGALNWSSLDKTNTTGSAYVFDPNNKTYVAISTDGLTSDGILTEQIPPMQGLFTESVSNGNFVFDISKTVTSQQKFLKSGETDDLIIRLKVTGQNGVDCTVIGFNNNATDRFVPQEDSKKLYYHDSGVPQIAFIVGNEKLAINRCKNIEGTYPISIEMPDASQIELSAEIIGDFDANLIITVVDNLAQKSADLKRNQTLRAALNGEPEPERFSLQLQYPKIVEPQPYKAFRIFAADSGIRLESPKELNGNIAVFNLLGQKIIERKISGTDETFPTGSGHFIVQWRDTDGLKTEKVVVP